MLAVLKFGGSTFQEGGYARIAEHLAERCARGEKLVVVASARAGATEAMREMAAEVGPDLSDRTTAALLPLADSISAQLLCHACERRGLSAVGLMAAEMGIVSDERCPRATVVNLCPDRLRRALDRHHVVTIPGGQAATASGRQTWLGKNSSDLSAVLLADMLGIERCELYSDVPGIHTADPGLVSDTRLLAALPYEQVIDLAISGAKVVHPDAVRRARAADVELVCRRNAADYAVGTTIGSGEAADIVCVDRRAKIFPMAGALLPRAQMLLAAHNVPCVILDAAIAVTCGYSWPERLFEREGLPCRFTDDALLTVLHADGRLERDRVPRDRATARAEAIHRALIARTRSTETTRFDLDKSGIMP